MSEQQSHPDYWVTPARYARGKVAVRFRNPPTERSRDASLVLLNALNCDYGCWSHRESAYIVTRSKVEKMQLLLDNGFTYAFIKGLVRHNAFAEFFETADALRMIKDGTLQVELFEKALDGN